MLDVRKELEEARQFAKKGDYDHAMGNVNGVLMEEPHNTDALFMQGAIYLKLDRLGQAVDAWERTLVIDPDHAKAHEWLNKVLHKVPQE